MPSLRPFNPGTHVSSSGRRFADGVGTVPGICLGGGAKRGGSIVAGGRARPGTITVGGSQSQVLHPLATIAITHAAVNNARVIIAST